MRGQRPERTGQNMNEAHRRVLRYQRTRPLKPAQRPFLPTVGGFLFGAMVGIILSAVPSVLVSPRSLVGRIAAACLPLSCGVLGAFFLGSRSATPPTRGLAISLNEERLECLDCEQETWQAVRTFDDGRRSAECLSCHDVRDLPRQPHDADVEETVEGDDSLRDPI